MFGYTAKMILLHFKSLLLSEQFAALMEIYILYTNYFSSLFMFPKKDGEVPVQPLIRVIKIDFTIKKEAQHYFFKPKQIKKLTILGITGQLRIAAATTKKSRASTNCRNCVFDTVIPFRMAKRQPHLWMHYYLNARAAIGCDNSDYSEMPTAF